MTELPKSHPNVYTKYLDRHHSVRRVDRYWAGLSSDLIIEQVLMQSAKSAGGLTRGRGMTKTQRATWLLSTPVVAEVNRAMQEFTGIKYESSDQHKDAAPTRVTRDHSDAAKVLKYLQERDIFDTGVTHLINISTGEVADENVNVFHAGDLGEMLVQKMLGQPVFTFSFKRKDMATTMKSNSTVEIDDETVHVDSELLFQWLIAVYNPEELSTAFEYELSTRPLSLFDKDGLMKEADKPKLKETLKSMVPPLSNKRTKDTVFVLDGGSILHKVPWMIGQTFAEICNAYILYIKRKYGAGAIIVFDGGYEQASAKDTTHLRRTKGRVGKAIVPSLNHILSVKKASFLLNNSNKQVFLFLLGEELSKANIKVIHSDEDADLLIVQTALEESKVGSVTIIGEDTDLLVLALFHHNISVHKNPIYFTCESKANMTAAPDRCMEHW